MEKERKFPVVRIFVVVLVMALLFAALVPTLTYALTINGQGTAQSGTASSSDGAFRIDTRFELWGLRISLIDLPRSSCKS